MVRFNILVVQNSAVLGNKSENFQNVEKLVENYKDKKIDIIVLPELFALGWKCSLFQDCAENENSETSVFLSNLAKKFNAYVIGGSYIRKSENNLYNTCEVFDNLGNVVTRYDKMHLFQHYNAGEADYNTIGNSPKIVEIKGVKFGLSICYDIRFPELFRSYALNGVKVLINVAAWPKSRKHHWYNLQCARAIENQAYMVAVSQCGKIEDDEYNLGRSMIISPFGEIIEHLDEDQGAFLTTIDIYEVDELRQNVPTLKDINPYGYKI